MAYSALCRSTSLVRYSKRAAASEGDVSTRSRGCGENVYKTSRPVGSDLGSQVEESHATGDKFLMVY